MPCVNTNISWPISLTSLVNVQKIEVSYGRHFCTVEQQHDHISGSSSVQEHVKLTDDVKQRKQKKEEAIK